MCFSSELSREKKRRNKNITKLGICLIWRENHIASFKWFSMNNFHQKCSIHPWWLNHGYTQSNRCHQCNTNLSFQFVHTNHHFKLFIALSVSFSSCKRFNKKKFNQMLFIGWHQAFERKSVNYRHLIDGRR